VLALRCREFRGSVEHTIDQCEFNIPPGLASSCLSPAGIDFIWNRDFDEAYNSIPWTLLHVGPSKRKARSTAITRNSLSLRWWLLFSPTRSWWRNQVWNQFGIRRSFHIEATCTAFPRFVLVFQQTGYNPERSQISTLVNQFLFDLTSGFCGVLLGLQTWKSLYVLASDEGPALQFSVEPPPCLCGGSIAVVC